MREVGIRLTAICLLAAGSIAAAAAPSTQRTKVGWIDAFGQNALVDYPDKVKSEAELKADAGTEAAYYAALTPPTRDRFGGLPDSGARLGLRKTGFFHVEQHGGKWFCVDPDGNLFYVLGVTVFAPTDDFALVEGQREQFQEVPDPQGPFATAYRPESNGGVLSFHLVNQIRKYGQPYEREAYVARMIDRLQKWGFNAGGPYSGPGRAAREKNFPYMMILPTRGPGDGLPNLPGLKGAFDPYEPKNQERIKSNLAKAVPPRANDPLLIGYYSTNEPHFEDVPRVLPRLNGTHACKRELVKLLQRKYPTVDAFNAAWKTDAKSFDALSDMTLPVTTAAASADVQDAVDAFFDTYFKLIHDEYRALDPNHMLLGCRFQSGTINNERLIRTISKYVDVMSFNYYAYGIDQAFLKRIYGWAQKPLLLSEFFYSSPAESGVPGAAAPVATQNERGLGYRNYVEQTAANGFTIGATWFEAVDQSVIGRAHEGKGGENFNTGLLSIADRPYKPLLAHVMQSNYGIYDVVAGKAEPFVYNDPKFTTGVGAIRTVGIYRVSGDVPLDGTATGFPGKPSETIPGQRLVSGADAGGVEGSFKLAWDDRNLYVLVDVVDPTPMLNGKTGKDIWNGDGIELFIGPEHVEQDGAMIFGDHQVVISGGLNEGRTQWWFYRKDLQPASVTASITPKTDGRGYTVKAAIPFTALGFTPQQGQTIRFDLAIDDSSDGKRRERQLMWNGTARASSDRTAWGRATFTQ